MRYLLTALRHPHAHQWWALRPWRRHSLVLALCGLIYIGIGCAYIAAPHLQTIQFAARIAPIPIWGILFATTGTLALLSSRWPPASEKWGYSALSGTSAVWASLYAIGTIFFHTHTLTAALVWALVTLLWWAVAGLNNPGEHVIDDRQDGGLT